VTEVSVLDEYIVFHAKLTKTGRDYLVIYVPKHIVKGYGLKPGEYMMVILKRVSPPPGKPKFGGEFEWSTT